jgi:hypothetical protein
MDSDRIAGWLEQMDKETTEIRQEALKMAWYMRGGLTYEQILALSAAERTIIGTIIKDNMDTTKKTGLPFF